jgi:hypothetical protein
VAVGIYETSQGATANIIKAQVQWQLVFMQVRQAILVKAHRQ